MINIAIAGAVVVVAVVNVAVAQSFFLGPQTDVDSFRTYLNVL